MQMNSLSKQVSKLSQELQEMTHVLKPLLQTALLPNLINTIPNLRPASMSASQLSTSICHVPPAPAPSSCLRRPDTPSLLDNEDMEGFNLPGYLLPVPNSPNRPKWSSIMSSFKLPSDNKVPSTGEGSPEGASVVQSLCTLSSNGIVLPLVQDHHSLASYTPTPSLSSLQSLSPSQGPHPSRPGTSASRGLLTPPPSQDTPPLPSSHCSASPSLTSSPGDICPESPPVIHPVSPCVSPPPPAHSLPLSLDFVGAMRGQVQTSSRCKSQPGDRQAQSISHFQELEMQEWGQEEKKEGRTRTEYIGFIDEEDPVLWTGSNWKCKGEWLSSNQCEGVYCYKDQPLKYKSRNCLKVSMCQ